MKKNKKLFIGLLAMSAFFGSCFSFPAMVKDIPPSYFEENRGEGERLVYITVERADVNERGQVIDEKGEVVSGLTETHLFIVTDNAVIGGLTDPYTSIRSGTYQGSPSIQNSILIYANGLAVFSLPKFQENIGFSYYCSTPVKNERVNTAVSLTTESIYSTGHGTYKIDPRAGDGDIAIRVILRPSGDETVSILASASGANIEQMISGCNQYGTSRGTGASGFIAAP